MAIYHVTTRSEWEAARATGSYRMSTKGATLDEVGFIHASSREQLPRVATMLYAGTEAELVVLELDDDGIRGCGIPIPWESGGTEELFPHVYGALLVEWVTAVYGARVESNGDFRWA